MRLTTLIAVSFAIGMMLVVVQLQRSFQVTSKVTDFVTWDIREGINAMNAFTNAMIDSTRTERKDAPPSDDGLPRIAYVTFSYVGSLDRWRDVIFPSTDLFVPPQDPYYVVLTKQSQSHYQNLTQMNPLFANYSHRIQPIFVDCPEGKFGLSPCCKQEQGLLKFYEQYYYDDNKIRRYDWILFQDDDMYIRLKELQIFVIELSLDHPMILASGVPNRYYLGWEGYPNR
jgi:hypothetical protein